jgi:hypothetical protein
MRKAQLRREVYGASIRKWSDEQKNAPIFRRGYMLCYQYGKRIPFGPYMRARVSEILSTGTFSK